MTIFAFLLIVFSAGLHASWNLLAKRSTMSVAFYAVICMTAASFWLHTQFWTPVNVPGLPWLFFLYVLCSITSGGATSNHHVRKPGQSAGTCHAFIVIDPKIFGDAEEIKSHLSTFLQELRDAKRADESVPIYTHGEKEMYAKEKHLREGIDVDISTVLEMVNICRDLGIDSKKYLGDVDLSNAKETTYKV